MSLIFVAALVFSGVLIGILASILGIGGGVVLVPLLVALGYSPQVAVGTSSVAILFSSVSGSIRNLRERNLAVKSVLLIGLPSLITAQLGVRIVRFVPGWLILFLFSWFLAGNIYLMRNKKSFASSGDSSFGIFSHPVYGRIIIGGIAGVLAGFFGIGGGVIIVPFQLIFLKERIKDAVRISVAVVVLTSCSSVLGHSINSNISWDAGLILGMGGVFGAQIGARTLSKIDDSAVVKILTVLFSTLALYMLYKAYGQF